jgi:hypothetical protein
MLCEVENDVRKAICNNAMFEEPRYDFLKAFKYLCRFSIVRVKI